MISLTLTLEVACIPVVQNVITTVAKQYNMPDKDIFELNLAAEEAILNVINYGLTPDSNQNLQVDIEVNIFVMEVSVKDWGVPFDFESLPFSSTHLEGMGFYLMNRMVSRVDFTMGAFGRIQKLIKLIKTPVDFARNQALQGIKKEEPLPDNLTFSIEHTKGEDVIMVSQCIYDEFGYSYPYQLVYSPAKFLEAVKLGHIYSLVSRASTNEAAGHLALVFNSMQEGTAEMGIGVVKVKFRKCSVMNALTNEIVKVAQEQYHVNAMVARPVMHHTITQHMCNKVHMIPCMFNLNCFQFDSKINNSSERRSVACAILPFIKPAPNGKIYLPKQVFPIADWIYSRMGITKQYVSGNRGYSRKSVYQHAVKEWQHNAEIYVDSMDNKWPFRLQTLMNTFKGLHIESVCMFLNTSSPSLVATYNVAARFGFFCTGMLPMCTKGDYLVLVCLMNSVLDYSTLATMEPFTSLLNLVRAQDPNEVKYE